jgi:DNA-binding MarR family transcriptional regulator
VDLKTHCLCALVRKASRSLTSFYDQALAPSGLRVTQFSLLANINRQGTTTASKLSKLLLMDKTTLTRNLNLLEKRGLIAAKPGRDGRVKEIVLSEKGKAAFAEARPLWKNVQDHLGEKFGESRAADLMKGLDDLLREL